ncbi:hypothetical protein [Nocardioides sp. YIM 152315]|uniref:hypothetical protein n=1 Tax=Nocardioides sp. YIM 152315 TaxID=3031760 RepID=UPI0023DC164A|nr:hypothetical protein [Nocardioides sp. YIM 152315]MDF1602936.1 hypothetical protein [Nocardioides sp. YIM 152315]
MARRTRHRAAAAAALATLLLPLAACGDDDPPAGDDPASTSSPSEPEDESTSAEPSEEPSVEAATGPLLEMPNVQVNAPEGWKKGRAFIDIQTDAHNAGSTAMVVLASIELPAADIETPLAEQMKSAIRTSSKKPPPTAKDPVELGGVEWYHIYSDGGSDTSEDIYGVDHGGYQTRLTFSFADEVPLAEQQETTASVLASLAWR